MERLTVESRTLRSIAYGPDTEQLLIEFRSGRIYCYSGVPRPVYDWLARVRDKVGFFNRTIRDRYPWRDVTAADESPPDLESALRRSLGEPD
jgi:hypothetical protein